MSSFSETYQRLQKPRPSVLSTREKRTKAESEFRKNAKAARVRDGGRCRVCGTHLNLHAHHLVPRSLSGKKTKHQLQNIVTLCGGDDKSCHTQVTRHVVDLHAMTDRGADGPIRVSKFSDIEGGFVTITEKA